MDHWPLQWFMTYWISKLSKTPYTQQQKLYDSICCMNCNLTFPFNKFQTKKRQQLGELLVVPSGHLLVVQWLNYKLPLVSNPIWKIFNLVFWIWGMTMSNCRGWKTVTIIMKMYANDIDLDMNTVHRVWARLLLPLIISLNLPSH